MSEPTVEQRAQTRDIFKNIVQILEHGMFIGINSGYVAEAIGFLNANIKAMEAMEAMEAKPIEPLSAVEDPA